MEQVGTSGSKDVNTELRERAVLPVLIPLVAIVLTEIVVFSMSRVLLVTGKNAAVVIALGAALAILIGAAFVAARPRMSTQAMGGVLALLVIVSIGAGAWAMQQKPFYEREAEANRPTIEVSAADLAFDTKTLELAADGTVIEFNNADSQPHNIAIFPGSDATGEPLFKGEIIQAGASGTYQVPAIEAGERYFHCDVHPNMNGKAVVEEAAAGSAEGGESH